VSDEPHKNPVGLGQNDAPKGDAEASLLRSVCGLPAEKKGD